MDFAKKQYIPRSVYMKRGFGGYCPRVGLSDSQWFEEENLSTRAYPYLRPRACRRKISSANIRAMGHMDGLCYLEGSTLCYGEHRLSLELSSGTKELLSFGAYVIIRPDMVWVNTADHSTGPCQINREFETDIGLIWCDHKGDPLEGVIDGPEAPKNPNQFWLDTSETPPVLKEYAQELYKWREVDRTYLRLWGEGVGELFPAGSRIMIEKCVELIPYVGTGFLDVSASGRDFLVIPGRLDVLRKEMSRLRLWIHSPMPFMDHMIAHENRLWGCRYGLDQEGKFVNEIYASALGDFTNWYSFRGIASDSYVLSMGAEGPFTGAAVVGGYPVFFKENSLHKIYGTSPASYRLQSLGCVGIAPGSGKSAALLDHALVYLGRDGFYRYDGSVPQKISRDLDGQHYSEAVAATLGSVYYACVREKGRSYVILTYDGEKGIWHRESGPRVTAFQSAKGVLYYTGEDSGLYAIGTEEGTAVERLLSWEGTTGLFRRTEDKKGFFTGLRLRVSMEPMSSLSLFAEYDSRGVWEPLGQVGAMGTGSREIPLRIRRCDHFRLKLKGRGDMTLYDLRIEMEG